MKKQKNIPIKFNEKKATCKLVITLLAFLSITIALLITVDFHSYLIKNRTKQKIFLPFYKTSSELKQLLY